MYGSMLVADLKKELRIRGAKVSGTKDKLIERLQDYDRNRNFKPPDPIIPEEIQFILSWPENNTYASVHPKTVVPTLDIVHINMYFLEAYKDNEGLTEYAAVHRKGLNMMLNQYLSSLISAQANEYIFFKGQICSENSKTLTYYVKVAFSVDGSVVQSECECVAGKGPKAVCKHVAVVCYAVLRFRELTEWRIKKSVTELSQSWNMPKKLKRNLSPKKAEDLSFEIQEYGINKRSRGNLCYDPRPEFVKQSSSKEWKDACINKIINYSSWKKKRLGLSGALEVANLEGVVHDHDYLDMPFYHQLALNKVTISEEEAKAIEKKTRKQSAVPLWHVERSLRVTASNVGEICKFTDMRDKEKYAENLVSPKPHIKSKALEWGKVHEKTAIEAYAAMSYNNVTQCGLIILPTCPYLAASPDGLVADLTVLEVKCPFSIKDNAITPDSYPHIEEVNGELRLKESSKYYYQVQVQMHTTAREFCDFFVWTNVDEKRISVKRNDEFIHRVIIPKIKEFHQKHMLSAIATKYYGIK